MTSGWIYQNVFVDLRQGQRLGYAASGPLGCHGNHCSPMLTAAVSRERAQGIAGMTGWFGQLFFPKFEALNLCKAHVQGPRCQTWT